MPIFHPLWSPDGKRLAFLSECSGSDGNWLPGSQDNIFVWTPAKSSIRQVSQLRGAVSSLAWSPDGRSVGFLFVPKATRRAGALDAMKPWSGVIGEDGVEVQQVAAVEVSSAIFRFLTSRDLHVYEFAWAPDSSKIVFVAAKPPGENNWWVARLYVKNAGTGGLDSLAGGRAAAC